jgi:phosphoglycolate phosphatase-like HAD superfamily hydrolase
MSAAPAVIFDLDGTLTDSGPGILKSTRFALERLNAIDGTERPIPAPETLTWIIGPPLQESFAKLVGADRGEAMLALYRERYAAVGMFENSLYRGSSPRSASSRRAAIACSSRHPSSRSTRARFSNISRSPAFSRRSTARNSTAPAPPKPSCFATSSAASAFPPRTASS